MNTPRAQRILNIADIMLPTAAPAAVDHGNLSWGAIASRTGAQKLGYHLTVIALANWPDPYTATA